MVRPAILLVSFLFLTGSACTPSPDSVCEHLVKLSERQWGDLDKEGPGLRDSAIRTCVSEKNALKRDKPAAYKCFADCVTSKKDLVEVADCETRCDVPKKTPPPGSASEEVVEGIPGLWTDPYADAREDGAPAASTSASTK
jgi:hypothetical protein